MDPTCREAEHPRRAGPEERRSPEISGTVAPGKKGEGEEDGGLPGGDNQSAREEEQRRARAGCAELRGLGLGAAHAGRKGRGGKGPREREERRGEGKAGPGQRVWAASFPSSFPFSFSTLKPFKPFHLNSNKFEFKPNTNKTMHQHECTSKLTL
jgi:hypothetical protein